MKASYAVGLAVVSVLITVAVEESRIADLRRKIGDSGATETVGVANNPGATTDSGSSEAGPLRTKSKAERRPDSSAKPTDSEDEALVKTVRKMWDNPAGKSMMNQGVKIAVAMMYQDFIEGLGLKEEEAEYFRALLGKEVAGQQEMGMKMMGASAEQQQALVEEMKQLGRENEEAIKEFLNDEEDYQKFKDYKDRMPERQQLEGIRATMESKGAPLDEETETRLVETMHRVRTESAAPDFSGPGAMEELAKGNLVDTYEKHWESQQEVLRAEVSGFLSPDQMEAFQEYQKQLKDMQLMGLKMTEKMMQKNATPSE